MGQELVTTSDHPFPLWQRRRCFELGPDLPRRREWDATSETSGVELRYHPGNQNQGAAEGSVGPRTEDAAGSVHAPRQGSRQGQPEATPPRHCEAVQRVSGWTSLSLTTASACRCSGRCSRMVCCGRS